ncbi:MAG: protein BatD [Elusimicrobiaceae bacterium]|nr:protein BatD [Elusimicrobiaceae bacterium]
MTLKKLFLFFIFSMATMAAFAQTQVYARVDKTYAEVKEEITLTINVVSNSTNIKNPIMPSLPNFNIYSSGQARNVSMINGKVSVNMHFNYILSPRFAGKSTIGSFAVEVDGQVYKTEPIEVEVYRAGQGSGAKTTAGKMPAYSSSQTYQNKVKAAKTGQAQKPSQIAPSKRNLYPDFFMTAKVDKMQAYLNEQINLKIRFYQNKSTLGNPQYERPKMEGFIFEDIKTNEGFEEKGGSQYRYIEFEMALFGILPGEATIGSAKVEYVPSSGMFDAFDMFFGSAASPQIVKTEPIEITIKPLPTKDKTANFAGAVGRDFQISTQVDKAELHVGETLVLTTKISGIGNMRAIDTLPALDLGPSFRIYDSTSSSSTKIRSGLLGGIKEFKTIIVPRTSGNFTIPPSVFQYFNPQIESYQTIQSAPINLKVLPALDNQRDALAVQDFSQNSAQNGKKIERISRDIYYLKKEETSLLNKTLTAVKYFGKYNYLLFAVLALALLINFISKGEFEFLSNQKAYLKAKRKISKAQNISAIAPALQEYLAAKQGKALGIMTIAQSAKNLKLDTATSTLLNAFWQELEMLKYAPSDTLKNTLALKQFVQRALNLLKQIEKEAK